MRSTSNNSGNRALVRKQRNLDGPSAEKKQPAATEPKSADSTPRTPATRVRSADDKPRVTRFRKQPDATAEKPATTPSKSERTKAPPVRTQRRNADETLKPARRKALTREEPVPRQRTQPSESAAVLLPDLIQQIQADSLVPLTLSPPEREAGQADDPITEQGTNRQPFGGPLDVYIREPQPKKMNLGQRENKFRSFAAGELDRVSTVRTVEPEVKGAQIVEGKKNKKTSLKMQRFNSASQILKTKLKPTNKASKRSELDLPKSIKPKETKERFTLFSKKKPRATPEKITRPSPGELIQQTTRSSNQLVRLPFNLPGDLGGAYFAEPKKTCLYIQEILTSPKYEEIRLPFEQFMEKQYVNEYVDFVKSMAKFEQQHGANPATPEALTELDQIVKNYFIGSESQDQILNVPADLVKMVKSLVESMVESNDGTGLLKFLTGNIYTHLSGSVQEQYFNFLEAYRAADKVILDIPKADNVILDIPKADDVILDMPKLIDNNTPPLGRFALFQDILTGVFGKTAQDELSSFMSTRFIDEVKDFMVSMSELSAYNRFDEKFANRIMTEFINQGSENQLNLPANLFDAAIHLYKTGNLSELQRLLQEEISAHLGESLLSIYNEFQDRRQ